MSVSSEPTVQHAICAEQLNERFGPVSPRAAVKVQPAVDEYAARYIARAPFLVLSTASADGRCDASPKGGRPGFVLLVDERTLLIPDYKGNALFFGLRNILENPQVGLLFMIPGVDWTLRIGGQARLVDDDAMRQRFQQAAPTDRLVQLAIEVTVEECYFHCPKAYLASGLWEGLPKEKFDDLPPLYSGSRQAQAPAGGEAAPARQPDEAPAARPGIAALTPSSSDR